MLSREYIQELVGRELDSDIGSGDVTSLSVLPKNCRAQGEIVSRISGVIAGLEFCETAFMEIDKSVDFTALKSDGDAVFPKDVVARVSGDAIAVLSAERTALNFLCHLSGIATKAKSFVDAVAGTGTIILDTRKTIPGMRLAEKYAVECAGAQNHRFGLFDMILIKDNHIAAAGGIDDVLSYLYAQNAPQVPVEIEISDIRQLETALKYPVDRIMLDNFEPVEVRKAIEIRNRCASKIPFECSGGIKIDNVRSYAETGVEFISVGAITHSAPQLDLSLDVVLSTKKPE